MQVLQIVASRKFIVFQSTKNSKQEGSLQHSKQQGFSFFLYIITMQRFWCWCSYRELLNHCQCLALAPSGPTGPLPADNLILSSSKLSRIDPLWETCTTTLKLTSKTRTSIAFCQHKCIRGSRECSQTSRGGRAARRTFDLPKTRTDLHLSA